VHSSRYAITFSQSSELTDWISSFSSFTPPRPCHCLSPQRCNVNDALYIRRCWCSSDAVHTRGRTGTLGEARGRVKIFAGAAWGGSHSPADAREVM
jgi:hypothetical protein